MPAKGELVALKSGDILHNGRYRIVELVGSGGFGTVYKAVNTGMWASHVAVKASTPQLPPARNPSEQLKQQQFLERARQLFEEEARLLYELRHSNLPRVTDYFDEPGLGQFMVMDFIEGVSLADLLEQRGGPLPEAEALHYARQVGGALHYLHSRRPPIIHRDVKPGNIILTGDNQLFLVDFGIAKVYQGDGKSSRHARGTSAGYSPPEQYDPRVPTTERSDIYSLGATLYTLLTYTGRFEDELLEAPARSSQPHATPPPRRRNPAVSEQTSQAVMAALRLSVDERPPSVSAFLALLPELPYAPESRPRVGLAAPPAEPSDQTAIHEGARADTPTDPPIAPAVSPATRLPAGPPDRPTEPPAAPPRSRPAPAPTRLISKLPLAGQLWLGRFQIERSLTDDPRYQLFMARDNVLQRDVEIWLWRGREHAKTSFVHKSLSSAAALHHHEAVATVAAHGNADGYVWLAVLYMAGGSLVERLAGDTIGLREAGAIMERLAAALDYAHANTVFHGDIHPRHVLFDAAGAAYLSFLDPWEFVASEIRATHTIDIDAGHYRSPERLQRYQPATAADDIYSLGGVLFRMLTGASPQGYVAGDTTISTPATSNATRAARRKLSSGLRAVFDRALAAQPAARYPTAGALAGDLRRAIDAEEAYLALFKTITTALLREPELLEPLVLALREAAKQPGGPAAVAALLKAISRRPGMSPRLAIILELAAARPDIVGTLAEFVAAGSLGGEPQVTPPPAPARAAADQRPSSHTTALPSQPTATKPPPAGKPLPLPSSRATRDTALSIEEETGDGAPPATPAKSPPAKSPPSPPPAPARSAPPPSPTPSPPALRIGSTFNNRYDVHDRLEDHRHTQLFLARDRTLGRKVTIRAWLDPQGPEFAKLLRQLARLDHWAVAPMYDFGDDKGRPYVLAPFFPGGSLAERLGDAFAPGAAVEIIYRVAEGLTVLHGHGLIHGRLEPGSILFDKHDHVWLSLHDVDPGQGVIRQDGGQYSIVATPYTSPEQEDFLVRRIDYRADIYALGIILYEMLAGRPPFLSDDPKALAEMHRLAPIPPIDTWHDIPVPRAMEEAIRRALSKKPADRYPAAYQFGLALAPWRGAGVEKG